MTNAEHESKITLTKDTPYLALTSKLWGVYHEYFGEMTMVFFYDIEKLQKVLHVSGLQLFIKNCCDIPIPARNQFQMNIWFQK